MAIVCCDRIQIFVFFCLPIILLVCQLPGCAVAKKENKNKYETCKEVSGGGDPRKDFADACKEMCGGICMQPKNFESSGGGAANKLFCQCKNDCLDAKPAEADAELNKTKSTACLSTCTAADQGNPKLCIPSDGAAFADSLCTCVKPKGWKKTCSKEFADACTFICLEEDTCEKTKLYGHYCVCSSSNPIANNEADENYQCEQDGNSIWAAIWPSGKKKKARKCVKHCDKQTGDHTPYFCTQTDKGKTLGLPEHVCACTAVKLQ